MSYSIFYSKTPLIYMSIAFFFYRFAKKLPPVCLPFHLNCGDWKLTLLYVVTPTITSSVLTLYVYMYVFSLFFLHICVKIASWMLPFSPYH